LSEAQCIALGLIAFGILLIGRGSQGVSTLER
jgi:hypothetical protein